MLLAESSCSMQQLSISESGIHSAGELLHTPHTADFDFHEPPDGAVKNEPTPFVVSDELSQLSILGPTLGCYFSSLAGDTVKVIAHNGGTSNGGILTYNWRESPSSKQPKKTTGHAFEEPNFLWMNVGVLPSYPIQTTVNPYIRTTGQLITDFHGILHDFPGILHQFKRTFTSPILNPKFPDFRNVGKYLTFIFWGFPLNHTPGAF